MINLRDTDKDGNFEETADLRGPFLQYLELEDSKKQTFMLHYLHISMICEAGVKPPFSIIKKRNIAKKPGSIT